MRYWLSALFGVVLSAAAVTVVAWCTWAWTRTSLCTPADTQLACKLDGGEFALAIAAAIFVLIPLASVVFMRRTRPRGTSLGFLALGLAMTAAGGGALVSALGNGADTSVEVAGYITAGWLLSLGPMVLFGGIATTGRRGEATIAQRQAVLAANGGDVARAVAAIQAARRAGGSAGGTAGARPTTSGAGAESKATVQLGTLAAQLSQIAAAKERTSGEAVAASLRQLDDLRASGLLSGEEHARKRREILDNL